MGTDNKTKTDRKLEYLVNLRPGATLSLRVQAFSLLPDVALLSANEITALSGRSRTSLWRDVRRGILPPPVRIGLNAVRWCVGDVRQYLTGGHQQ